MKTRQKYKNYLENYLKKAENLVKESTYATYNNTIRTHIIPILGEYYMHDITSDILQNMVIELSKNGRKDKKTGLSLKSIKDIMSIIKLTLKDAAKSNIIEHKDIQIIYPKTENSKKIKIFSKTNQKKISQKIYINFNYKNLGILLCMYTGLRIGEICALKWSDIDFETKILFVNKTIQRIFIKNTKNKSHSKVLITSPKSKSSNREIPLSNSIYNILKSHKPQDDDVYLLTGSKKYIEPRTYRSYYDKFIKNTGIEHINFHALRHTFATRLIESGVDYKTVSELLGHSSVNITLNLYIHPHMEQKRKAVECIDKFV
ncbi:MAG: tyrosine-type recombinase/integrase [Peptoanaerobacter stomatis]|uniref:tyrosine-type recombinase/integrase n=1 Tax=Peptoanaerobacter stomatis TaxID=796937 RepID=UPI003FA08A8F